MTRPRFEKHVPDDFEQVEVESMTVEVRVV